MVKYWRMATMHMSQSGNYSSGAVPQTCRFFLPAVAPGRGSKNILEDHSEIYDTGVPVNSPRKIYWSGDDAGSPGVVLK